MIPQVWYLHGPTMRSFIWLLFFPGIQCAILTIEPDALTAWEGSCILIPCVIARTHEGLALTNLSLIWYFEAAYDKGLKDFNGNVLFNSNMTSEDNLTQTSPRFLNRVRFTGDLDNRNCSLKISKLQKADGGTYGARIYGILDSQKQEKFYAPATVKIDESPPKPNFFGMPSSIQENNYMTVTCSVLYHCPDEPVTLTLIGLEEDRMSCQKTNNLNRKMETELTFTPTWKDHGKKLTCLLKSHNGTEISQSTTELNVRYAPQGVKLSASPGTTVREGEKLFLNCTMNSSNPEAEYQWYWNSDQQYNRKSQTIELNPVKEQNSGNYKCGARNDVGTSNSEIVTIDVQYAPKETNIINRYRSIKEGDHIDLQCSSRGNPPIDRYEWYKGSKSYANRTSTELSIKAIELTYAGTYFCRAYNRIGNGTSSSITLDVQYAPKNVQLNFINQLPIKEGNRIALNCSVGSSNPSHRYKWYKSTKQLSYNKNVYTFPAPPEKTSIYICEACNSVGCTSSASIKVEVLFAPKEVKIVREPMGQISEGGFVKLRCEVGPANPKELNYTWYKNGQWLQLDSIVTIQKVDPRHSGIYRCEAENSMGKNSSTLQLDVRYGPRNISVSLITPGAITEGMEVELQCENDANPLARGYTWYWNDQILQESSKRLRLQKIQVSQAGSYGCKVSNDVSEGESQPMALTVSYSRATVLRHALIGLGIVLSVVVLLGFLFLALQRWRKTIDPGTGRAQRSGSFFVKKAKGEKLCNNNNRPSEGRADNSLGFLNQAAETTISYAALRFPPNLPDDRTIYSSINKPSLALDPSDETVLYSVIKKPELPSKGDSKHDYENVVNNEEEELHYSSLVNLAPRPRPTYVNSDTDSESEESIQYASLKH